MQTEPLLTWSEPATELLGFVSLFLANGAIGFRYAALRGSWQAALLAAPQRSACSERWCRRS